MYIASFDGNSGDVLLTYKFRNTSKIKFAKFKLETFIKKKNLIKLL